MSHFLTGKRVAVMGLARSGIGAAKLIHRLGGRALVSDVKPEAALREAVAELQALGAEVETGGHRRIIQDEFDLIVLSPGIVPPPELEHSWQEKAVPVWSELELSSRVNSSPWLGVTGSNGKTTTAHLLHSILLRAGHQAELVGNIGNAWSNFLPAEPNRLFVVEVSSFQLEHSPTVKPRVAVLLNLFENHLDRHGTMEAYAELKSRLFRNQTPDDTAIVNGDDERVIKLAQAFQSRLVLFGHSPQYDFWTDGSALYCRSHGKERIILRRADLPLIGRHNELNALAASAAAYNMGVSMDTIGDALREARAVEHRIEFVDEKHGVQYVNDSKSTNLVATQTALDAFDSDVILLFGGRPKKESFAPLRARFPRPLKAMIVFGEAEAKVRSELPDTLPVHYAPTLQEATKLASIIAESGDAILLSPGCASFDQYQSYEERGRQFKSLVRELP